MISCAHVLDRKIKESNIEEIFDRLQRATTDQSFFEILAELGKEIASNPLFEPYIKYIAEKEKTYRKTPHIYIIIQYASFCAQGEQQLNQEMLIRTERISEYFSVWLIIRSNELYDIALHDRVRNELKKNGNLRDLADFEEGVVVVAIILKGNTNWNLRDFYLPHTHRAVSGIIRFFDKQQSISCQSLDSCSKNKAKASNKTFKLNITVKKHPDKKSILLSTDGKKNIRFALFAKNEPSKHTNQIKLFFELIKGPIAKYTLTETLKLSNKQIEKAFSTINTLARNTWKLPEMYVIYDITNGQYSINPNYPTKLEI